MISTYRVNPEISAPIIIWGIAGITARSCRTIVDAGKGIAVGISAVLAAVISVFMWAVALTGHTLGHKLFRATVLAAMFVAGVVGLALLAAAQPMVLVGCALIAAYGVMTWGWR